MRKPAYAIDLDKTLAYEAPGVPYDPFHIGPPIPKMVQRVRGWLAEGIDCWIFTARASDNSPHVIQHIMDWTEQHIGKRLNVTATKYPFFVKFFDDRATGVIPNTGELID